ncbi:hypothetical protein ACIBCR_16410 [Micromonospora echinospora]|uniref:hypothetical protein n=1 Tax=Micromonospora echinospora TaxID=1877 RepID=UPI00379B476A
MATRKDHPETSTEGRQAKTKAENADRKTADQVQKVVDRETEQGFRGIEVDPTPNENYTVAGVTSGAPTPETDDKQAQAARDAQDEVAQRAAGVAER